MPQIIGGFKGTEFVAAAVDELRARGLVVDYELVEGVSNDRVPTIMQNCDILVERAAAPGYGAQRGIEGMASGLPVVANLESETYTTLFRRAAGTCNRMSDSVSIPRNVDGRARHLVRSPALRETLGRAGRLYAEKYHSYRAAEFLFGNVYDKLNGSDVDLQDLFHPLKTASEMCGPIVRHPLIHNHLPQREEPR